MPNIPWTDVNISNEEYTNRFWVNWAEGLVHEQETKKITEEQVKKDANADLVESLLEEFPDMTEWEQENAVDAYNRNIENI